MKYPTLAEVKEAYKRADRLQLATWQRFLPSPGMNAIESDIYGEALRVIQNEEVNVMNHIMQYLKDLGGLTPEISKHIGWGSSR